MEIARCVARALLATLEWLAYAAAAWCAWEAAQWLK